MKKDKICDVCKKRVLCMLIDNIWVCNKCNPNKSSNKDERRSRW